MPLEYPIVITEFHNTYETRGYRWGWKVSAVSPGHFQWSIHLMDGRTTARLRTSTEHTNNLAIPVIFSPFSHSNAYYREFYSNESSIWLHTEHIISRDHWNTAMQAVQAGILGGWFPETVSDEGIPTRFAVCEHDGILQAMHSTTQHEACMDCGDIHQITQMADAFYIDEQHNDNHNYFCLNCEIPRHFFTDRRTVSCPLCSRYSHVTVTSQIDWEQAGLLINVCPDCRDDALFCSAGDHYISESSRYSWLDEDDLICANCENSQSNPRELIESWNYRPSLEFHPEVPTDPLRPLYIGIELEMTWPQHHRGGARQLAYDWLTELTTTHEGLLYVKGDSSVEDGWEVVTHPMEPDWALENFPFDFFQEAIDHGASATHTSTGTHVHIDKASLTTAQLWKMLQLHYKLKDFCGIMGGRGTNASYASWEQGESMKARFAQIAREKGRAFEGEARYVPVNVRNEHTIELRYMAGGISPDIIRKNIEWVKALYDFTDYISVQDIKQGVLNSPAYLLGWVLNGSYPSVAQYLTNDQRFALLPQDMPERV